MSWLQSLLQGIIGRVKHDAGYRIASTYTDRQLATTLWYRGLQVVRGIPMWLFAPGVRGVRFRGRRVMIEHGAQLTAGAGLILEDDVFINALSDSGIVLGQHVTIARGAMLVCTGVIARKGIGISIGDHSAIGAGSFVGGQGGVTIGRDVIMGPGVRVFSENHVFTDAGFPIRLQGETRQGVSIGDDCWIGGGATILDGVSIGAGCVVAAGAVVTSSVAAGTVVAGVPARAIRARAHSSPDAHAPQAGQ